VASVRRPWVGWLGFAAFGLVGAWAGSALPSIVGALVGALALTRLTAARIAPVPGPSQAPLGWDRRRFLTSGATIAVAAVATGSVARAIDRARVDSTVEATKAPLPTNPRLDPAASVPAGATVNPATPFITPKESFYRTDTALSFPRVSADAWTCSIDGLVDTPLTLRYADLLAMPQVERVITLCCVSNEVGGPYIGTATWRGVLLADVFDRVGVQAGAQQVFSTSTDGWTSGFPVEAVRDGRDAMIAIGMNGDTLPLERGYPARLVVPGLYGYVSATKWLSHIELTTWDELGYWVPRGWAQLAPVKTQSRIDVPRASATLPAGPQKIAGVAWAQHRGIARVEVRVDAGPWQPARLGSDVSDDAWRQWVLEWDAAAGDHTIEVRATDKTGATQTEVRTDVAPDGATGHHTVRVTVSG
jgi:sulfite oxidase